MDEAMGAVLGASFSAGIGVGLLALTVLLVRHGGGGCRLLRGRGPLAAADGALGSRTPGALTAEEGGGDGAASRRRAGKGRRKGAGGRFNRLEDAEGKDEDDDEEEDEDQDESAADDGLSPRELSPPRPSPLPPRPPPPLDSAAGGAG